MANTNYPVNITGSMGVMPGLNLTTTGGPVYTPGQPNSLAELIKQIALLRAKQQQPVAQVQQPNVLPITESVAQDRQPRPRKTFDLSPDTSPAAFSRRSYVPGAMFQEMNPEQLTFLDRTKIPASMRPALEQAGQFGPNESAEQRRNKEAIAAVQSYLQGGYGEEQRRKSREYEVDAATGQRRG